MENSKGTEHGGRTWIRGRVEALNRKADTLQIGKDSISIRDVPKHERNLVSVGDIITAWFEKSKYYATHITNHSMDAFRNQIGRIPIGGKMKKTPDDFKKLISDLEPFCGHEIVNAMSETDRREIRGIMESALDQSIALLNITASYEDTKKEVADLAEMVLETAAIITIVIDGNTSQIFKRLLPKETEEKK